MKKLKKPNKARLEKELDKAWSEYVRGRDKRCQLCGGNSTLAAHHAFGRVHRATRWDVQNGCALCWPCHQYRAHGDPAGFAVWFEAHVGRDQYLRLSEAHRMICKFTVSDLEQMLSTLKNLGE